MDFELDYRYALDCEINPKSRPCDGIRSQMLQLVAQRQSIPTAVYFERLKDLLQEYSVEIDKKCNANTFISTAVNIAHRESLRQCVADKWKSGLKKKLDDGLSVSELLPQRKIYLEKMMKLSNKFRDHDKNRIIFMKAPESVNLFPEEIKKHEFVEKPLYTSNNKIVDPTHNSHVQVSQSSTRKLKSKIKNSPTRVPGMFKKRSSSQNDFTRSLFAQSSSQESNYSGSDSQNSQSLAKTNAITNFSSQETGINENESEIKKNKKVHKTSFITGLEKHLIDQVINNDLDKDEARKIIEDVRKDKPEPFKDPKIKKTKASSTNMKDSNSLIMDERLKGIEPEMIELIKNEIISNLDDTDWSNIAGLEYAKSIIQQVAILPLKRPDLFTGLRSPPKGILLFGPPGTGKTMIGRCIASQTKATFFSITSSTLTSKWIGDGEKAMKTLFKVARCLKPSVIFIDEVDSLLKSRSDSEHESSRRMKTEFLAQFDGLSNQNNDGLLIIGTTNRPQELDEAVRRRFAAKLYIPLPERCARKQIIINSLKNEKHCLTEEEINTITSKTDGYSGSDMKHLCSEAAMYSIREITERLNEIGKEEIREINFKDFLLALQRVKPSFTNDDLGEYENWNKKYGLN